MFQSKNYNDLNFGEDAFIASMAFDENNNDVMLR